MSDVACCPGRPGTVMLLMSLLLMLGLDVTHLYTKDISCFDISEVTFNNVYLDRDVLGVTESPSLMDCIGFCYLHPCCRSVGFEPQSLECHLHKHNSSHSPRNHVSSPGWLHTDMASWSQVRVSELAICNRSRFEQHFSLECGDRSY